MKKTIVEFDCPHCREHFKLPFYQKANHIRWCKNNPRRSEYLESLEDVRINYPHTGWSKGLTKETSYKISTITNKLKEGYATGRLKPTFLGRKHSEKTKKMMSRSKLQATYHRVCKKTRPYTKSDGTVVNLDSSYEVRVAEFLDRNGIEWIRPEPLEWIDKIGKKRHYFPDFYLPSQNIFLDPKNNYCFKAQQEKIKYIVDHYDNVIFLHKEDLTDDQLKRICRI